MGPELLRSRRAGFVLPSATVGMQRDRGAGRAVQCWCALPVASPGLDVGRKEPGQVPTAGHAQPVSIRQRVSGWPPALRVPLCLLEDKSTHQ